MKLSLASVVLAAAAASSGALVSASSSVRGGGTDADADQHPLSTVTDCNGLEKQSCLSSSCLWCECAAVPSSCYTKEDAKGLPPGVFTCDSTDAGTDTVAVP